jgi:hypothetical protein
MQTLFYHRAIRVELEDANDGESKLLRLFPNKLLIDKIRAKTYDQSVRETQKQRELLDNPMGWKQGKPHFYTDDEIGLNNIEGIPNDAIQEIIAYFKEYTKGKPLQIVIDWV